MRYKKKGFSLIEIIVSLAIVAIIMIPLSNVILTSVKTNKGGEDKQQAAYVAQQVLEGLRNSSSLENSSGFIQQTISVNSSNKTFTGTSDGVYNPINIGNFVVNLNLSRDTSVNLSDPSNTVSYDGVLTIGGDNTSKNYSFSVNNSQCNFTLNEDSLYIEVNDDNTIYFKKRDGTTSTFTTIGETFSKIKIAFADNYSATNLLNIYLKNNRKNEISSYMERGSSNSAITPNGGVVTVYNISTNKNKTQSYNVNITINKNGNSIYNLKSSVVK
ncbi:type IV pilus modification PilV family protein [Clostridium manihotivorum]|uniref:Prepilin-type N-terminal cleavage/methylation domain-containing protein n=1 Tax=Clostridium manihotivorum TaxID=2320868 RepID=A0A410DQ55_9CLOT|nr:type II secretion system protein [Clostridium manihotivorum]QAA31166.1 hypothetical protein C1I91_05515 [Clostridium manihotivorum]